MVVLCCAVCAQQRVPAQATQRLAWTTEEGLPQNSVHAVLQTRDGYLWVATEGGVARFNGVQFERIGTESERAFASNDACCLTETRDGALWIGTSDGLVRWSTGKFKRFDVGAVLATVAEPAGALLALTGRGLERLERGRSVAVALPDGAEATALGVQADGMPLIAAGAMLWRLGLNGFEAMGRLPAAPAEVLGDALGRVWLRTTAAVWMVQGGAQRQWRVGMELPGSRLLALERVGGGVLASTNRGVYRLQAEDAAVQALPQLEGTAILSATLDREGDTWFGTDTAGLVELRERPVGTLAALSADTVTSVVQGSDSALWVGTRDNGLKVLRAGEVTTPAGGLALQTILALAPDVAGGAWVGTPDGLYRFGAGQLRHVTSVNGLPEDFVRSLLADGNRSVWVGTRHGAAHWDGERVDRLITTADGLPSDVVGTMLRTRDGTLWFGTLHGLARMRGSSLQTVPLVGAAADDGVTALAEAPTGMLLVGTRTGALLLVGESGVRAVRLSGLRGEIDALLPDGLGNVWIRMAAGVARVEIQQLLRCGAVCAAPLRVYSTADGMPSVDATFDGHPSAWRAADGTLWFATRRGIARIDAAHLAVDRVPPPVVLERMQVDDLRLGAGASIPGLLRLGPGHRRFVFEYAGLSLRAPLQVQYRFKLEGFDRDWVEAGSRRSAEYTSLPAGAYRFLVEARTSDGVRSAAPAEMRLYIASPVYRRSWFYVCVALALAGVAYGIYRLRLRRVQREFAAVLSERNRIAREIHDTLAQDFVAVSLQLEVTSQLLKVNATEAAREQIDSTRLLVRDGIRDARESIWALRAGQTADGLPARLQALAEGKPAAVVQVAGAYRALASSVEKEMSRIAKEAVGNARNHAGATTIAVDLVYLEDAVLLTVRDDGAGFNVEQGRARVGHFGLRGMVERASAMGATLTVQSAPGDGTTVSFRLQG